MLSDDDPPDGQAVALFFATETYPLDALRNIFESSGIKTIINESGIHSPEYTVICGTPEYVKSFLAKQHMIQEKTLCIVWAETRGDTEVSFPSPAKTVYLIPRPIDPQTANDILAFFFTGQERTFDLSGGNLPMAGPQTESGSERDSAENDNAGDETSSDVNPDILRLEDNLPASAPEPKDDKTEPLEIRQEPQSAFEY